MDWRSFLASGKKLLDDTKAVKLTKEKRVKTTINVSEPDADPHKGFVKRTVSEKPDAKEVIKDIKRFITAAEEAL